MQQGERNGHFFQNELHVLAFFLPLKIYLQQLHAPPLNAGEKGKPRE
jgi:hypothetical protein